jgi:hypothetical protein
MLRAGPSADFRPFTRSKLIPAGTDIAVNVHYTPNGTPVRDHVRIGFTLAREPPQRRHIAMSTSPRPTRRTSPFRRTTRTGWRRRPS